MNSGTAGDEVLGFPPHDVDHAGRGVYDLGEHAYLPAGLRDDPRADYILNEVASPSGRGASARSMKTRLPL